MTRKVLQQQAVNPASEIVRHLLNQSAAIAPSQPVGAALSRRVAVLERQGPEMVQAAKEAGVEIEYLGVQALPPGPMYYNGVDGTGWVMGPATTAEDAVVPKREAEELKRLYDAGIYIPRIFVAHEVKEEQAARVRDQVDGAGLELEASQATELVGPIPPPAESVALGERMAERSRQVVAGLRRTGQLAVGAITIPARVAIAVAEAAMVDPIILGAIPAASEQPGAPASWFELTRWDW